MPADLFGPLITGDDVQNAIFTTVQRWMPTYLAEIERRLELAPHTLPEFRSYEVVTEFDHWPEDQLPGLVVVAPGLLSEPRSAGDGQVTAEWAVGVAAVVSGNDAPSSMRLAQWYAACLRWIFLQQQSLGQFAESTQWLEERYDDLGEEDRRNLAAGFVQLSVTVVGVADSSKSPFPPPAPGQLPDPVPGGTADPYTPPPVPHTVQSEFVSIVPKE